MRQDEGVRAPEEGRRPGLMAVLEKQVGETQTVPRWFL
jgi:hypothetical protein